MPRERELRKCSSTKGALMAPRTKLVRSYDLVAFDASRCRSFASIGFYEISILASSARQASARAVFCCALPSPPLVLWDLLPLLG